MSGLAAWGCAQGLAPHGSSVPVAEPPVALGIVVTAGLHGALEPCGCTEAQRGGLARLAGHVADARRAHRPLLYVDGGDALFARSDAAPDELPAQRRRARAVAQALTAMGLWGLAPGPLDDALGAPFRSSLALPELPGLALVPAAGGGPGRAHPGAPLVAILSPRAVEELPELGREARRRGARFVLALVPTSAQALADADARGLTVDVDLSVATRPGDPSASEAARVDRGTRRLLTLPPRGQALLRVELNLLGGLPNDPSLAPPRARAPVRWRHGGAERARARAGLDERVARLRAELEGLGLAPALAALKREKLAVLVARRDALDTDDEAPPADADSALLRVQAVEASHPPLAAVQAIVEAANADIRRENAEWAARNAPACPEPSPARPAYVGSEACRGCHPAAFAWYEPSKHRQAWEALVAVGKELHLDCIGCHVTGWREPGGVCRVDVVQGRAEAGCEACHGPGLPHLAQPVAGSTHRPRGPERCVRCHDAENSPGFAFEPALALVRAPGHGVPLPGDGGFPATLPRSDGGQPAARVTAGAGRDAGVTP